MFSFCDHQGAFVVKLCDFMCAKYCRNKWDERIIVKEVVIVKEVIIEIEVIIVKEVISCDGSPVVMFCFQHLRCCLSLRYSIVSGGSFRRNHFPSLRWLYIGSKWFGETDNTQYCWVVISCAFFWFVGLYASMPLICSKS